MIPDDQTEMAEAIREVELRRADRIAVPGKWKVWREGDQVKHEVTEK
jgi:hypothetical protein